MSVPVPASTLASSSSFSSPNPDLFTPSPSHTSMHQVPDVYVTPPEEEHGVNPPFCYFDAAMESKKSLSTTPDIEALDVALGFYQQNEGNPAPIFRRVFGSESQETVVMPRRGGGRYQDFPVPADSRRDSRGMLDEDVVEVVKVRKSQVISNEQEEQIGYTLKKSRTFRARATQALRSIKNVGKTGRRAGLPETWSASSGRENIPDGPTEDGVLPRSSTPNLVRKKSIQLSQIFATSRNRSATPDVPMSPTSPTLSDWSAHGRQTFSLDEHRNSPYMAPAPPAQEVPTSSKGRSFMGRISVLDLHKLFSPSPSPSTPTFSKAPPLPVPSLSENIAPSVSRTSTNRDSISASGTLSSGGFSSNDDDFSAAPTNPRPPPLHASSAQFSTASFSAPVTGEPNGAADTSFELQLDSLQFDSLHFDPDEF